MICDIKRKTSISWFQLNCSEQILSKSINVRKIRQTIIEFSKGSLIELPIIKTEKIIASFTQRNCQNLLNENKKKHFESPNFKFQMKKWFLRLYFNLLLIWELKTCWNVSENQKIFASEL